MRREDYQRYNRYKWILGIVIISFVFWGAGSLGKKDIHFLAARVGDKEIGREEFLDAYRRQYEIYQQFAKNNPELMRGLPSQTLNSLIDKKLLLSLAEDYGLLPSEQEIAEEIGSYPIFQDESGAFVGSERYRATLKDRLRTTAQTFEGRVAEDLAVQRFASLLQDTPLTSLPDIRRSYRDTLTVRFNYVRSNAGKFLAKAEATEEEIGKRYAEHKESYRTPEKRLVDYIYLRPSDRMDRVQVTDDEVTKRYLEDREAKYHLPEERRASHILFKIPGDTEAEQAAALPAIEKKANEVLARARAGEDFAELAQQYSEDTSAAGGGDLGFFPRERMVGPFSEKAFSMNEGDISDLVRTEFGFHIIKLTGIRKDRYRPLDEVRAQVENSIKKPRALEMGKAEVERMAEAAKLGDFDAAAKSAGVEVKKSEPIAKGDSIKGVGRSDELEAAIFGSKVGTVSDVIPIVPSILRFQQSVKIPPSGYLLFRLSEVLPPAIPPLADVKSQVEKDVKKEKADELAAQEVKSMTDELSAVETIDEWKQLLEARGYTPQDSGAIARASTLPSIPDSTRAVKAAYDAGPDQHGTFSLDDGTVLYYWTVTRQDLDDALLNEKRKEIETRLQGTRQNALRASIVKEARKRFKVERNEDLLKEFVRE